jgi:hypothetical protein
MRYKSAVEKPSVNSWISLVALLSASCAFPALAQVAANSVRCPVLARLPGDLNTDASPDERLWFELSQCNGETVIVHAFERHKKLPSLTVDTAYSYPALLSHTFNILILESFGGTAYHVLVIAFHDGKPSIALRRSAGDHIRLKRDEKAVIISVPPKTYPGPDGKFPSVPDDVYTFEVEY